MKKGVYLILVLSGWIFSILEYIILKNENKRVTEKLNQRENEIRMYKSLSRDVETARNEIDNIINTLETIKGKLQLVENKLEKGEKNGSESSQNRK